MLGAEFTLKLIRLENQDLNASQPNGWGDGVSKVGKTNDQGEYVFENLPNGEYLLTETHAPQGYHGIDDTDTTKRGYWTDTRLPGSRTIVITSSSGSDGVGGNPDAANRVIEYTYANEPKSDQRAVVDIAVNAGNQRVIQQRTVGFPDFEALYCPRDQSPERLYAGRFRPSCGSAFRSDRSRFD